MERFRTVISSYYRGAQGIILVYDVTSRESFGALPKWFADIEPYVPSTVVKIIVGNKVDKVRAPRALPVGLVRVSVLTGLPLFLSLYAYVTTCRCRHARSDPSPCASSLLVSLSSLLPSPCPITLSPIGPTRAPHHRNHHADPHARYLARVPGRTHRNTRGKCPSRRARRSRRA